MWCRSMDDFDNLGPAADFEKPAGETARVFDVPLSREKRTANGVEFPVEFEFESRHSPGDTYVTKVLDEHGFVVCDCVGFSYRQRCWHATEAREKVQEMMNNGTGDAPSGDVRS